MNGFDPEQRSGELEVIMESDARSESSDLCRASGDSGRGRCMSLDSEGPSFTPPGVSISPDNLLEVKRPSVKLKERVPEPPPAAETSARDSEYHLTVSRSSQQLREEFFNTTKPADTKTGVTDNIGISLVETKNAPPKIGIREPVVADSKNMSSAEQNIKKEDDLELKPSSSTFQTIKSKKSESTVRDVQKSANKSPLLTKKGNKAGSIKSTNLSGKIESTPSKYAIIDQSKSLGVELSNQLKPNISSKTKSDLSSKKDTSKSQSKTYSSEVDLDAPTSSATLPKNIKVQETSSTSSGKPPSGSARQRKKATSKVPNRDSLDPSKKKQENEKT